MITGLETKYMRKDTTPPPHLDPDTDAPHQGKMQLQVAQLAEEISGLRVQLSGMYENLRDSGLLVQQTPDEVGQEIIHGTVPGVCAQLLDLTMQVTQLRQVVRRVRQEQVF